MYLQTHMHLYTDMCTYIYMETLSLWGDSDLKNPHGDIHGWWYLSGPLSRAVCYLGEFLLKCEGRNEISGISGAGNGIIFEDFWLIRESGPTPCHSSSLWLLAGESGACKSHRLPPHWDCWPKKWKDVAKWIWPALWFLPSGVAYFHWLAVKSAIGSYPYMSSVMMEMHVSVSTPKVWVQMS